MTKTIIAIAAEWITSPPTLVAIGVLIVALV